MNKKYDIVYQGIIGSYTSEAIFKFGKKHKIKFNLISKDTFQEVFEEIKINKEKLAMIPIENSIAGSVVENYDLLLRYDIQVIGEIKIPIRHCLLCNYNSKLENIKNVFSHPQALLQCNLILNKLKIKPISNIDTAYSAKYLSKNPNFENAAIASEFAAKKYKLKILKKNIQNEKNNFTRFLLIKNKNSFFEFEKKINKKPNKTSIIFELKSIPAALYKCLGGFATNNINLTKIESRPIPDKKFEYLFFIDFDGNVNQKEVKQALNEVKFFSKKLIILGSYTKYKYKPKNKLN